MAFLEVVNVHKHFGGVRAVNGVSLSVERGEIRAIIGPNGAGKTTLLHVLSGRYGPDSGAIFLDGRPVGRLNPVRAWLLGIGRSFQITNIFRGLTVLENVAAALLARSARWDFWSRWALRQPVVDEAMDILERVGLGAKASMPASALSHGEQRHLEIALVLAGRPRLLLLDEPTAGMVASEAARTMALLAGLVEREGVTVVFTEHDMQVVFSMARRVTVMHQGCVIAEGTPEAIRQDERVRQAYLGSEADA